MKRFIFAGQMKVMIGIDGSDGLGRAEKNAAEGGDEKPGKRRGEPDAFIVAQFRIILFFAKAILWQSRNIRLSQAPGECEVEKS